MRWLTAVLLCGLAAAVPAETIRVCYNYGCAAEAEVRYSELQLAQVRALLGAATDPADERERLALAVGWLLGWAGEQTPIAADRGGNQADDGVFGRMDCIDHATTTTRLLRLLEERHWLRFHQVTQPVLRVRYLLAMHFSAQIEEVVPPVAAPAEAAGPDRFVVDSWFRDNGQPAVVLALTDWLDGAGEEESAQGTVVASGPVDGP